MSAANQLPEHNYQRLEFKNISKETPQIRTARVLEIPAILALFDDEVQAGRMLPRKPDEMKKLIADWLVIEVDGKVVGCVSLIFYNNELCELRSLAVHPDYQGRGLGKQLIGGAVELAKAHNMRRVLSLTRAAKVFDRAGFKIDMVANYPEKVWRDCRPCPFQHNCDEIALIYDLSSHTTKD